MIKNYGLSFEPVNENDWIFGAALGKADGEVINFTGNWLPYLPDKEAQSRRGIETNGCTIWASLNAIETLLALKGYKVNYSDRYLANVAFSKGKLNPSSGADPRNVVEIIRTIAGCLNEGIVPWTEEIKTVEEFYGISAVELAKLIKEGERWFDKWELNYKLLWGGNPTQTDKRALIEDALAKGTVCASVVAWSMGEDGKYTKVPGSPDGHWTQIAHAPKDKYVIFDSYDGYLKDLDPLYDFNRAMIFYLTPAQPRLNILQQIINVLRQIIGLQAIMVEQKVNPPIINQPKPRISRIPDWAKAIESFESAATWRNNPGAIRGVDGKFLEFKSYNDGFAYLCDYLTRACVGKHPAYPKGGESTLLEFQEIYSPANDSNDPLKYSLFVANKLGVDNQIQIKNLL